jgi:hypothetical protein
MSSYPSVRTAVADGWSRCPPFPVRESGTVQPESSPLLRRSPTLPEFDVTVLTLRSGTQTIRVEADDPVAARALVHSECGGGRCHCPPEWCTDDVQTDVVAVRTVGDGCVARTPNPPSREYAHN